MTAQGPELVCPAGTPAALRAAVDAGADAVYVGFRDATNARNFPGLNFSRQELEQGVDYARARGAKIYLAVNTFARAGDMGPWRAAIDDAASIGVDSVILADLGVLDEACRRQPGLRLHLSVQASAAHPAALRYYAKRFGVRRAVLPRVLTLGDVARVTSEAPVETEVFVFGGMCPMAEGRCHLSSYATGKSPNTVGVCSPASHVRYSDGPEGVTTRLGAFAIDCYAPNEPAGYPTLCKGRFRVRGETRHIFEEPVSLDARTAMPDLVAAGVTALKIEGRQRGRAYIGRVVAEVRAARDAALCGRPAADGTLKGVSEGTAATRGALRKDWR